MIKAVLFDMDGVVVNNKKQDVLAWRRLFSDFGKECLIDTYEEFSGMTGREIVRKYINKKFTDEQAKALERKKEQYFAEVIQTQRLKEVKGLTPFLELLLKNNYKIALATAALKEKAEVILKQLKLEKYFAVRTTADEVSKGKPDPEIFLKAAKKVKCKPEECVVIEDSPLGVMAAKKGGMKCIALTTTHKKSELMIADKLARDFEELKIEDIKTIYSK